MLQQQHYATTVLRFSSKSSCTIGTRAQNSLLPEMCFTDSTRVEARWLRVLRIASGCTGLSRVTYQSYIFEYRVLGWISTIYRHLPDRTLSSATASPTPRQRPPPQWTPPAKKDKSSEATGAASVKSARATLAVNLRKLQTMICADIKARCVCSQQTSFTLAEQLTPVCIIEVNKQRIVFYCEKRHTHRQTRQ